MIKNYLKSAFRNLTRNKAYGATSVVGLAVGIAACLLIFLVVDFELSFDNFHKDRRRIFRVVSVPFKQGMNSVTTAGVPLPVAGSLRTEYPQLQNVAAIFARDGQVTVPTPGNKSSQNKFKEEKSVYYAEPSFFDIFQFDWLAGDPKTGLIEPNTAVLTQETAKRYFGDWQTAIGKTIQFNNKEIYQITGILKNPPSNTDFPLKIVISYKSLKNVDLNDWEGTFSRGYCFVLLPQNLSATQFNLYLRDFVKRHKSPDHINEGLMLQPLAEMHFDSRFGNFNGQVFTRELITALSVIGIFLLVIACVNFVNLATAQALYRSKEVGIRKVLGGIRRQLIIQFMAETIVISIISVLLGLMIAKFALPYMNAMLAMHLDMRLNNSSLIIFLVLVTACVSILSGTYPSFVLSGFNPIQTIKNNIVSRSAGGTSLRKGLVVFQFCIAQLLIVSVLIVVSQMNFLRHANLGFDKEAILAVPVPSDSLSQTRMEDVRIQLLQQPGIRNVSFSTFSPADDSYWNNRFKFDHASRQTEFLTYFKWADTAYFSTYKIQFLAGRPYGASDTVREFVVNETLVKKLGLKSPGDIIGKEINFWDQTRAPVVGVVKDFNGSSMHDPISPMVLACWKDNYQVMGVKIRPDHAQQTISAIEKIWNTAYPDYLFEYQFLDEKINNFYQSENQLSLLYKIFAGIAIFISSLGLYGLVSFMAVQRSREVGVRKVLGASIANILLLFSKEIGMLIVFAFLIAAPVAYYFMHYWLERFAFRIHIGILIFLITMAGSIIIAGLTVIYRAYKAAVANPVISLRSE